jgi:putative transposase
MTFLTMSHDEQDDSLPRRNSLRRPHFNYAARRLYFVTIVVSGRRKLFLDHRLANVVIYRLHELRRRMQFQLYCYCLMPDHLHLLIGMGESGKTLGEICGAFKSLTTRDYWRWHEGRLWQRQFYDHIIRNEQDYFESFDYIRMNPVRKGLAQTPEEWAYTGQVDQI